MSAGFEAETLYDPLCEKHLSAHFFLFWPGSHTDSDDVDACDGHVMDSAGESRESWCSKKDARETQTGQQRQRRDTRNNLSGIIGLGGVYKSKPKRQIRFVRYLQEKKT